MLLHCLGWVIIQFEKAEERDKVLSGGPYFIYGKTLFLRTIHVNFCFKDEDYSLVPIWVQLQSLSLQCWNTRAISRIASKIRKPICLENFTQERKMISYARVLVEIDTYVKPLESFDVRLSSGTIYTQYVYYENPSYIL